MRWPQRGRCSSSFIKDGREVLIKRRSKDGARGFSRLLTGLGWRLLKHQCMAAHQDAVTWVVMAVKIWLACFHCDGEKVCPVTFRVFLQNLFYGLCPRCMCELSPMAMWNIPCVCQVILLCAPLWRYFNCTSLSLCGPLCLWLLVSLDLLTALMIFFCLFFSKPWSLLLIWRRKWVPLTNCIADTPPSAPHYNGDIYRVNYANIC